MKKFVLSGVVAIALAASPSLAADMPVKAAPVIVAPVSWTGTYGGIHVGGVWDSYDGSFVFPPPATVHVDHSAGILGTHSGLQFQFGRIVVGVEGDFLTTIGSNRGNDTCHPPASCAAGVSIGGRLNHLQSVGGRVGWAFGEWLPYVAGGWARAWLEQTAFTAAGATIETWSMRTDGSYIGVGVDWQFMKGLVAGLEYRHYELRNVTATPVGGLGIADTMAFSGIKADTVALRLSYLFNPVPMLLK